ncbi:MAG TPA: GlsB/YeaQ/YmgE family stress response membrane protein [Dehalococcoidia bacterium]|nr:GlsB/YeaQ/YmgE family stress response membrane protein [Dehalococcoidia bacterium]
MGILAWLVVGLIAGVVAKALMPGGGPGGIILTILLGIAGAFVGGFLASAFGFGSGVNGFDIRTIVVAIVGAMVLLLAYRLVTSASGARA